MAITKTTEEDRIEIVGEHKTIQVRTATVIKEDGVELSRSFSRHVVECVTSDYEAGSKKWTHTETDISDESAQVQSIANAVWTDEVKAAKKSANEASML
jgi:hypothetical protein